MREQKAEWLKAVEAHLDADERVFLRNAVAKMSGERLERAMQYSPEDAAVELQIEKRGIMGHQTRDRG